MRLASDRSWICGHPVPLWPAELWDSLLDIEVNDDARDLLILLVEARRADLTDANLVAVDLIGATRDAGLVIEIPNTFG